MRRVSLDTKLGRSRAAETRDIAGERKFNSIDDATLAGAVRPRDANAFPTKHLLQVSNTTKLDNLDFFNLDHRRSRRA